VTLPPVEGAPQAAPTEQAQAGTGADAPTPETAETV